MKIKKYKPNTAINKYLTVYIYVIYIYLLGYLQEKTIHS